VGTRLQLQAFLEVLLGSDAVFFQPPSNLQMTYPCIVFQIDDIVAQFADNKPYALEKRYMLTVIDRNPDSLIPDAVAGLPKCKFDTHFVKDNLNHFVFNLYF
jgi:hypothetical protein